MSELRKSSLSRTLVTTNQKFVFKNVIQLIVQNYSTSKIDLTVASLTTEVPKAIKVEGIDVPSLPYKITNEGWLIESVEVEISFPSVKCN